MGMKPRAKFMREIIARDLEFKARAREIAVAQRQASADLEQMQERLEVLRLMIDELVADLEANPSAENLKAIRMVREALQELL